MLLKTLEFTLISEYRHIYVQKFKSKQGQNDRDWYADLNNSKFFKLGLSVFTQFPDLPH